ncbi:hypothetical protein ACQ4PT_042038 [Festuca glaucescens]
MAPSVPPWSQLPPELLGLVIDRLVMDRVESPPGRSRLSALCSKALQLLPLHAARFRAALRSGQSAYADGARFRAVCRSWCSAMREHVTTQWQLPWIVTTDCSFMAPSDCSSRLRVPSLPKNARCIGSTDSWLALDCVDDDKNVDTTSSTILSPTRPCRSPSSTPSLVMFPSFSWFARW